MKNKLIVPDSIRNERVDAVIAEFIEGISRNNIKNRLKLIEINGTQSKPSKKVSSGDIVEYELGAEAEVSIKPENVQLDIIYEDQNVFVINKPAGMVVHPAAGNYSGTMAQGIMYRLLNTDSGFSDDDTRPGIVHRLDKDTSGIIIAAKNRMALEFLSEQFRNRSSSKTYLAVINGQLPDAKGEIKSMIGRDRNNRKKMTWKTETGKKAHTLYKVLKRWDQKSFVSLTLKTGRTHQLRVHMLKMGAPITGDPIYARKTEGYSLMLHAYKLKIVLPGEETMREFRAPLPKRFKDLIISLSEKD